MRLRERESEVCGAGTGNSIIHFGTFEESRGVGGKLIVLVEEGK